MGAIASRRTLLSTPVDPHAALWRRAVFAQGGTVSSPQLARISRLIRALKACGAWQRTDDYAVYAAQNDIQALVTLKRRITQTLGHKMIVDPTFIAGRGFLGNTDGAIQTGWNPSVGGHQYVKNSARYGLWIYSAPVTNNTRIMGMSDILFSEINYDTTNWSWGVNTRLAGAFETTAHGGNLTGWFTCERTASNAEAIYRNAAPVGAGTQITNEALDNFAGMVLATTQNGTTVRSPTDAGISAAMYGSALANATIRAGEHAALRTYMTSVGVP